MKWKQSVVYFLCVSGIYLLSFGVYLFLSEELLKPFLSADVVLQPLRIVYLLLVNPVITFFLSERFPFKPVGLINPRFNDVPSMLEENDQQERV